MTRIFLSLAFLAALSLPAMAKCDPAYAPYYHQTETGPGSIMMDLFIFPFAVAIGTAGAPAAIAQPKRTARGGATLSHHPLCMAGHVASHAAGQRPARVQPY